MVGPDGETLMIASPLKADTLRTELSEKVNYQRHGRSMGLVSRSRTFGYMPRLTVRRHEACRRSTIARDYPEAERLLVRAADGVDRIYRRELPEEFTKHESEMEEEVLTDWRMGSSVFTSGIVNYNTALHYHVDKGNFEGRWSAMLSFRNRVDSGGALVFPQWRIAHACNDGLLFMFHGQRWWHGVTPMKIRKGGFRITVVFYSLRSMWMCLEPGEELAQARVNRTKREQKQAAEKKSKASQPRTG